VLFITHDFGVVAEIADRVAVMRQGRVVEQGTPVPCWKSAAPYTKQLIAAVPPLKAPPPRALSAEPILTRSSMSPRPIAPAAFSGAGSASPMRSRMSR
jgi:peptide/nickel transport system ATP-binding protein